MIREARKNREKNEDKIRAATTCFSVRMLSAEEGRPCDTAKGSEVRVRGPFWPACMPGSAAHWPCALGKVNKASSIIFLCEIGIGRATSVSYFLAVQRTNK